jgi:hypothetical protein
MNETRSINSYAAGCGRPGRIHSEIVGPTGASASSRALVAVSPAPASAAGVRAASPRPGAAFLAHVIATTQQAPQTRARRRAEPDVAGAIYAISMRHHIDAGRIISRTI